MKHTGLLLTVGGALVLSSLILSAGMKTIMHENRTVSVRGLSEKEVDADLAVWNLAFSAGGNNLIELSSVIVENTKTVTDFLHSHNLTDEDFSILAPEITDTTVNIYASRERSYDYIAKQTVLIRTGKIRQAKDASDDTLTLMKKGISVSSEYENKVKYYFNGLNEIKPAMIEEATKNARESAEKFATDSKSRLGKIMNASQGLFSIDDLAPGLEEKKKVRVVTSVVYSLKD